MADDLDIRRFFQRAPREWLIRYFNHHEVLQDFDWPSLKKLKVDPLVDAWLALDEDCQQDMVEDFRNLAMLSTAAGKLAIIDEAEFTDHSNNVAKHLAEFDDFGACAFWAYLERPDLWNGAVFLSAADSKGKKHWRKRINFPQMGRLPTNEDGKRLAEAVGNLFVAREGRGRYCDIYQIRRGDREYYFAYPQDHKTISIEYDNDGRQTKRPHKPAFEIIFLHKDADRTLSIWHDGKADRVRDLQVAFAKSVLGVDIRYKNPKDTRVYELGDFLRDEFQLKASAKLGIKSIAVRKIRIAVLGPEKHSIRIDLGDDCPDHILRQRLKSAMRGIPVTMQRVSQVGIRVVFEKRGLEKRNRRRTFEISYPNTCSLQNHGNDILIQRMLEENKIEPRTPPLNEEPENEEK